MGGKNPTTTTTQSSAPDPNAYNAYLSVLGQAQGLGTSTYQPYTGQLTAPVNQEQTTGIQGVNSYANAAQPAYQAALTQAQASSAPLTAAQIQQYQSPYTQQVVNATQNQFNQQNAQAQQGILGNAIAQGALGGNRSVIGQAELAGQQQTAQAPVIAGLENTGYNQAVSTAENQQQLGLQGAGLTGQLGAGAQTAGLQGAGQQIAAGTLQQTTQQAQDQALYQQYLNQQAYPYQQLSWLAGIDTGVGSNMGGTGNGTTVGPSPNVLGQVIGAGEAAAGLFGMSDRRVKENIQSIGKLHNGMTIYRFNFKGDPKTQIGLMAQDVKKDHPEAVKLINGILHVDHKKATDDAVRRALGGVVPHFDSGGVASIPYGGMANSIFPSQPISHGSGPPRVSAPNQPSQQQSQNQEAQNLGSLAKSIMSAVQPGGGTPGTSVAYDFGPSSYGGPSGPTPLVGMASGGGVRGYDDGGGVAPSPFDDRWNALYGDQAPPDDPSGAPYFIDADASQRWRSGVDTDLNRGQTMQALNTPAPAPPEGAPIAVAARGVAPPSQTKALANDVSSGTDDVSSSTDTLPPEIALGYAGGVEPRAQGIAPATPAPDAGGQDTSPVNSRFGPDSKLWPALVSAGFATMASRSPYLGNMIGEGGQAGIGSYNKQTEQERADKLEQQKMAFDRYKFDRPYSELTAEQKAILARQKAQETMEDINRPVILGPDGKPMVNPDYVKAKEEAEKSFKSTWSQIDELPSGQKVMGWVDPNTKQVFDASGKPYTPKSPAFAKAAEEPTPAGVTPEQPTSAQTPPLLPTPRTTDEAEASPTPPPPPQPAAPPHPANPQAPIGSEESRNTQFLAQVAAQQPEYAEAIKKAANYELDPGKYASMRNDLREKFINNVLRYDPNYNPQEVGLRYQAQKNFLPGTKTGDTIRSFNTAVSHLDVIKELYKAVNNGDVKRINKLKNDFEVQFGYAPPNTLNGLAQIVSGEVVKATVGSQNALGDREELRKTVDRDLSSKQATDVIDGLQALMGGQLNSLKFAYEHSTGLHNFDDKFLLPRSREVLNHVNSETKPGGALSPNKPATVIQNGHTYNLQPDGSYK